MDTEDTSLSYTLEGLDSAAFSVDSEGQLRVGQDTILDHESQSEYAVVVRATDSSAASATIEVTITITNVDEAGTVLLFPAQPRVGAVQGAQVSDPDGPTLYEDHAIIIIVNWQWAASSDKTNWEFVGGRGSTFTPASHHQGKYLRATANYSDREGSGKTAEVVSDNPIGQPESVPSLSLTTIVSGLTVPWDIAFTPDGTMLFTERGGTLRSRLTDGTVQTVTADLGDLYIERNNGLMAVVVDPGFASNRRFYTCQGHINGTAKQVQVIAWTINDTYTAAVRANDPLVGSIPADEEHAGCRLRFGPGGYLWIATGDASVGTNAQDLSSLAGKVLRVDAATGAGAPGNPFGASPRIYTYGHRNPQGLALRPGTQQMWSLEHGPAANDEINLLSAAGNYGWDPVPSAEVQHLYNELSPMTDIDKFPDAVEAKWSSGHPPLAPSGGVFLEGEEWGDWQGRLAVATLAATSLRVFEFTTSGELVSHVFVAELRNRYGRLRSPVLGPARALYITTSNAAGEDQILRAAASRAPTFLTDHEARYVPETHNAQDTVAKVVAMGPEDATLTYTLSGIDAAAFIVGDTGALRLRPNEDTGLRDQELLPAQRDRYRCGLIERQHHVDHQCH